jgi:hypothetical protein
VAETKQVTYLEPQDILLELSEFLLLSYSPNYAVNKALHQQGEITTDYLGFLNVFNPLEIAVMMKESISPNSNNPITILRRFQQMAIINTVLEHCDKTLAELVVWGSLTQNFTHSDYSRIYEIKDILANSFALRPGEKPEMSPRIATKLALLMYLAADLRAKSTQPDYWFNQVAIVERSRYVTAGEVTQLSHSLRKLTELKKH